MNAGMYFILDIIDDKDMDYSAKLQRLVGDDVKLGDIEQLLNYYRRRKEEIENNQYLLVALIALKHNMVVENVPPQ